MPQNDKPPISLDDLDRAPSALPADTAPVRIDFDQLLTRFSEVANEKIALEEEIFRLKQSVATSQILDELIKPYALRAFSFMCAYCGIVAVILFISGFKLAGFQLETGVLEVLAGSTAVTVIGLVGMVLTGIFVGARRGLWKN